jgi:hypothetical protein
MYGAVGGDANVIAPEKECQFNDADHRFIWR